MPCSAVVIRLAYVAISCAYHLRSIGMTGMSKEGATDRMMSTSSRAGFNLSRTGAGIT